MTPPSTIRALCSLKDLGSAYRKAKVDLFYSPRVCRRELLAFEQNLVSNLENLQRSIISGQIEIRGDWTFAPKSISDDDKPDLEFFHSNPWQRWERRCQSGSPKLKFRLMECLPIAFHVLATLWIQKVGHKFDAKLSDVARGNRLRRRKPKNGRAGKLNPLSIGTSEPYLRPYCSWRDDGLAAIREAAVAGKKVAAVTADVTSFFHTLEPVFMLADEFRKAIKVQLTSEEEALHTLFITALSNWGKETPIGRGLPVGLTASTLIANVALFELDKFIEREVAPLYYGRYVDDIILVLENAARFSQGKDVWEWLMARSNSLIQSTKQGMEEGYCFAPPYLHDSNVRFLNDKNRTYIFAGESGKTMLGALEQQIRARSSEWRSLPAVTNNETQIEAGLVSAIRANGESAENLRQTNEVSIRRAAFAIKIRDIQAYGRALAPDDWSRKRHAFLDAFIRHVLVLPAFFDFYNYLPRVIGLCCSCRDFIHLRKLIGALEELLKRIDKAHVSLTAVSPKEDDAMVSSTVRSKFREAIVNLLAQTIDVSFPDSLTRAEIDTYESTFREVSEEPLWRPRKWRLLVATSKKYRAHDLGYWPLKRTLLPPELCAEVCAGDPSKVPLLAKSNANELLANEVLEGTRTFAVLTKIHTKKGLPLGVLFPTRPPRLQELYILHRRPFSANGAREIAACLLALRGFSPERRLPKYEGRSERPFLSIPTSTKHEGKIKIAVASWKTNEDSWVASVTQHADPDRSRYDRLRHLVNSVIRSRRRPDYLVLPELSIPPRWFLEIASKLHLNGISLVSGVEYLHGRRKVVRNQVWAGLSHNALGFPSQLIYCQDKQRPAPHEELELFRVGARVLRPETTWMSPPVLAHGSFHFALQLCSELTNIRYRSALRGNVDALIVPEWNKDTESFSALVESAALDVHAYIVQCNDRQFGDSRIRAPRKESWERDIVRIKGGREDYFVVGEIDTKSLRRFQSAHRSPSKPFKPVPDGFVIHPRRKTLPKG